jgi:L-ascorbate metabolism protein UlaG (beta-lactamase superfamily)
VKKKIRIIFHPCIPWLLVFRYNVYKSFLHSIIKGGNFVKIRLIRHATLWLEYAGETILVDPMLSEAGANPPIINTANDRRNPLVPLPLPVESLLHTSLVLITHRHRDHWDEQAAALLSKNTPVICQPSDAEALSDSGFVQVTPVEQVLQWQAILLHRTGGQHGTGEIGQAMGLVSGFVLQSPGEPTLYLAGDTIYCPEVEAALDLFQPVITVVNAGGARFVTGDPITMTAKDVASVCRHSAHAGAAHTRVIAVHLDAINHCLETREDLRSRLQEENLDDQVSIPEDGDWL